MATWDDVRRLALAMPDTTEGTTFGNTAWLVGKNVFVWERPLSKKDVAALGTAAPSAVPLGLRTADLEMKEAMLSGNPRAFFTTPHFDGYPAVLVRLDKMSLKLLKEAIVEAWLARAPSRAADAYLARRRTRPPRSKT